MYLFYDAKIEVLRTTIFSSEEVMPSITAFYIFDK
tara:strand:- start:3625 stop:3729 length:105 start_codon:yes stop_codon:yes gene_type:complete